MKKGIIIIILLMMSAGISRAQVHKENKKAEYISWALLQLVPSPTIYQDADGENAEARFGLKWQVTPFNFSFDANKYVSPAQFFMISPVRRFSGSAELFLQPELATGSYTYSDREKFSLSSGARLIIPLFERGENLAFSLGAKYSIAKNKSGDKFDYPAIEAGLYAIGGIFGIQFTKNFNTDSKYNLSIYFKYF